MLGSNYNLFMLLKTRDSFLIYWIIKYKMLFQFKKVLYGNQSGNNNYIL